MTNRDGLGCVNHAPLHFSPGIFHDFHDGVVDLVGGGERAERLAESLGSDDGCVVVLRCSIQLNIETVIHRDLQGVYSKLHLVEGALVHAEHGDAVPDCLQDPVGAEVGEEQPRLCLSGFRFPSALLVSDYRHGRS